MGRVYELSQKATFYFLYLISQIVLLPPSDVYFFAFSVLHSSLISFFRVSFDGRKQIFSFFLTNKSCFVTNHPSHFGLEVRLLQASSAPVLQFD
jgi:hypothetical protein